MDWACILAYVTGTVDQELLLRKYLAAENRILKIWPTAAAHAVLDHYAWRYHCRGLFQMPIAA